MFSFSRFALFSGLLILVFPSCRERKSTEAENQSADLLSQRAAFDIAAFPSGLKPQDTLRFSAVLTDTTLRFDSLNLLLDQQKVAALQRSQLRFDFPAAGLRMGRHQFRLAAYLNGKENAAASVEFILTSDIEPESFTYEVQKTLPHERSSFTQGLEWFGGKLFEGTGLNGKSVLMEIDPVSGSSVNKVTLPQEHFGEGITIFNRQVYQLTWQSHRAFVYSLPGLEQKGSFGYPTEGWGLSHIGNELVMSDGSEKLYFMNPADFSLIRSIEVWDQKNPVKELNELESADGFLYANKYQTDTIVKIDPQNGKVLAYINMQGLLKQEDRNGSEDVLNGIAWHADEKSWYLTGKNWPKMFSVRWIRKKAI